MTSHRRIVAVLLAGTVAACAGLALQPRASKAQTQVDTSIAPPPRLRPQTLPRRPPAPNPLLEEAEPVLPPQQAPEAEDDPDAQDGNGAGRLTPSSDGGHRLSSEPDGPLDGLIEVEEPRARPDGIDDMGRDARLPEDIAAFERPPAGYDPYLYQIEPDPLRDRRPAELFRIEPYVARGVRVGSFVLFPEAEIGGIATNNIFRATPRQSDHALELRSNTRLVSDWRAHAVEFRAGGIASFYDSFPTEDDRTYTLEARGRLDISRRTNVEALISHHFDKDARSARDSPTAAAERGDIETSRVAVALNHRFNRLGLQLRGSVTDIDYAPVASIGGGIIGNDERDVTQRELAGRASWQLSQKVSAFGETAVNDREYHAPAADGILRSSTGERYRAGLAFGPWDATIRGEVSAGWGRQSPNDARLSDIEGFIVDANLAWKASALTTFLLSARTDFVDTTTAGSSGALSRLVGLEARHTILRHLVGTASISYSVAPYADVPITERLLTTELGLEYYLGRDVILYGRYQHVAFDTTVPVGDYQADIVRAGVRVRQ